MDAHQEEMINPQGTLVMKFGGSSVGGSGALRNAHAIVSGEYSRWENLAVVVSAMGGTTDALIECARSAISGNLGASLDIISELKRKHQQAINELFSDSERQQEIREELDGLFASLEALCGGIHIMGELTPRGMDAVVSNGERLMARLFSALLQQNGIPVPGYPVQHCRSLRMIGTMEDTSPTQTRSPGAVCYFLSQCAHGNQSGP